MLSLTYKENGFHFLTAKMNEEQLQSFNIKDLMKRMMTIAPDLWELLETLHAANSQINYQRAWTQKRSKMKHKGTREASHIRKGNVSEIEMADVQTALGPDEEKYWKAFDADNIALIEDEEDEPEDLQEQVKSQTEAIMQIVSQNPQFRLALLIVIQKQVLCMSIMMHSSNRRCNTFQSAVGVFLQSCNAPETLRELLAHMGVSVATMTINSAVKSLSKQADIGKASSPRAISSCFICIQ